MQTFITYNTWTYPDMREELMEGVLLPVTVCRLTAQDLDSPRLGKQRAECQQILTSLTENRGWIHHPATKMWKRHEQALAVYAWYMCLEWQARGYEDKLGDYFADKLDGIAIDTGYAIDRFNERHVQWPWWFGHPEMVETHRSKLLRKMPEHYHRVLRRTWHHDEQYANVLPLPYIWPNMEEQAFYVSAAEYKRKSQWEIPRHWHVGEDRRVSFDVA